ncbi:MAG: hypothetical protein M3T56_07435 [Chloroflexota bacterium]|nr:hypothetical protein [Chloroflexota bacterium]
MSSAPLPAVAGAFVLFQQPGETRLRAISFGAEVNGILQAEVAQTTAGAGWSQSPYGIPYIVDSTAYDRDGKPLGTIPWSGKHSKTWSSEGRFLCAAVPASATAGAQMRLETAFIGQPAKVVASGFTTYSDNAGYPVLACDEGTDRAIVAVFGQGIAPARLWVFRLSTGAIIRSVDYAGAVGWVAASADGSMLAESARQSTGGKWKATIRAADDGAQQGTIDDFAVQGFSGDKTLVVGPIGGTALAPGGPTTAVIDWKTGRNVWSTSGTYGGYLPEPAGRRLAVGIGFVGGSDQRDVYLVGPDGLIALLPERVRVALLY